MKKVLNKLYLLTVALLLAFGSLLSSMDKAGAQEDSPYTFSLHWVDSKTEQGALSLLLTMNAAEGYHSYAYASEGDVFPLKLKLTPAARGEVLYPAGRETRDVLDPSKTVQIYEGQTLVLLRFSVPPLPDSELHIALLACSPERCVPVRTSLSLPALPESLPELASLLPSGSDPWRGVEPVALEGGAAAAEVQALDLGPVTSVFGRASSGAGDSLSLSTVPLSPKAPALPEFKPQAYAASLEVAGLGKAVLFGLLAGLILNVMPCVLPVITLKLNALLRGGNSPENRRRFRQHNLWFAFGILFWFVVLALLFGMAGYAWGQLFQNQTFLLIMLVIVFVLALTMFDVVHLPVLDLRGHQSGEEAEKMPRLNAFLTGLLATLLATPCSGPLLGGVLSWSLMQGLPVLITVFTAMGLGMALPYFAMALWQGMVAFLPRPGDWMLAMERILGFFLLATCLYLLTIVPAGLLLPALALLLSVAFSAWIWGRWGEFRASGWKKIALILLCAVIPLSVLLTAFSPRSGEEVPWQEYSAEFFAEKLGTQPLFVEFTADWCPTCKVLERTTLAADNLNPLLAKYSMLAVRVDLTQDDIQARSLLKALGSASIPMLAVFPEGERAGEPVILRDIYTVEQMEGAVKQALRERP